MSLTTITIRINPKEFIADSLNNKLFQDVTIKPESIHFFIEGSDSTKAYVPDNVEAEIYVMINVKNQKEIK